MESTSNASTILLGKFVVTQIPYEQNTVDVVVTQIPYEQNTVDHFTKALTTKEFEGHL